MKTFVPQSKFFWPGVALAVLAIWVVFSQLVWGRVFRILPAFFLGVFVLILVGGAARLIQGARRNGFRWMVSKDAFLTAGWTIAFAISTVVLFYQVELWRGRRAWARVVDEAKTHGEPLTSTRSSQPVPDEQNFAKAPIFAPLLPPQSHTPEWIARIDKELIFTAQREPPYRRWFVKELPWTDQEKISVRAYAEYYEQKSLRGIDENEAAKLLLNAFKQYDVILDQVREYAERPFCQFPMNTNFTEFEQQIDHAASTAFRELERLLAQRASAQLVLGQSNEAFADTQLAFRLVTYYCQQPPTILVVRRDLVLTALQPLWEGLASRAWNEQQLSTLQRQLEDWNLLKNYQEKVRADALYLSSFVESVIPTSRSPKAVKIREPEVDRLSMHSLRLLYPVGWSLQDQADIHRFHLKYTRNIGSLLTRPQNAISLFTSDDPFFPIFVMPKVEELAHQASLGYLLSQTMVNEALLACALERYRLAHNGYPETLQELVTGFVSKIPADIVNGEPLKYHRSAEGRYILYSIGYNHVDDGGKPSPRYPQYNNMPGRPPNWFQGDWVWKYSPSDR